LLLPVHRLPDHRVRQNHPGRHGLWVEDLLAGDLHWVDVPDVAQVRPDLEVAVLPSEGLAFLQRVEAEVVVAFHWLHRESHQKKQPS
jgi:hypothetical protein